MTWIYVEVRIQVNIAEVDSWWGRIQDLCVRVQVHMEEVDPGTHGRGGSRYTWQEWIQVHMVGVDPGTHGRGGSRYTW